MKLHSELRFKLIKEIILTLSLILSLQPTAITEPEVVEEPIQVIQTNLPAKCLDFYEEVSKYNWNVDVAMNIMKAESGCNPNAINKTDNHRQCLGSFGLFQISCTTSTTLDPKENIRLAYEEKYLKGGWKHWSVCKNGLVNCGL